MRLHLLVTTALSALACLPLDANAFDWPSKLGETPATLERDLGTTATCRSAGFSVAVPFVDEATSLVPDLMEPVRNDGGKQYAPLVLDGPPDISVDRDDERWFTSDVITTLRCDIGRMASLDAFVFKDRIFRIALFFDRCEKREERENTLIGTAQNPLKYVSCDGVDPAEQDFDTELYQSISARNAYGYTKEGQPGVLNTRWSGYMEGEFKDAEQKAVARFGCAARDELREQIARMSGGSYRCLIDVDNSDPKHWSAAAMYEIFEPGIVSDTVTSRLTAQRLFIDMPGEHAAAQEMLPSLEKMIEGIKIRIRDRVARRSSDEKATSDVLGGGN